MPELPDVEGFKRTLATHATGHQIERVTVRDPGVLRGVSARQLSSRLRGRRFAQPRRQGKWVIAGTDGPAVLMHFGMTGSLRWTDDHAPAERFERLTFVTDGGELHYDDMRKLTGISLASDDEEARRLLGSLGPDALTVRPGEFADLLHDRRAAIKTVLMDQHVVAGLGNLLTDEVLWRACINPRSPASSLTPHEVRRLYGRLRWVLRTSIQAGDVPARPSWLTGVRYESAARCPRCRTRLCHARIGGRTSVWCPRCQGE
jgi:formamidopyrimidine-DNA glycosylase